jgi:hypothetical protein
MKKKLLAFYFTFCILHSAFSQAGEWVWIKGDSIPNQPGNFGVQGVPSPTNNPPALYEPCEWTDLNGNFWLFGGYHNGYYGDLWKFSSSTNEWTWMKGSGILNDLGNYGMQGVALPSNNPTARGFGSASWIDTLGNLWMYGGVSLPNNGFSDLWKYNIGTNEWTWVKGPNIVNQPGIYGMQGVSNSANNPSAKWECAAAWTDNIGDLWLFGGYSLSGNFNDLWKYHVVSNQWTWIKGSKFTNKLGNYGVKGIENNTNKPGARHSYSHWKDNSGKLWLFGGLFSANNVFFNDLWKFNPTNTNWTWMGGDSSVNLIGVYGTKCTPSSNNIPKGRFENRATWIDQHRNFWFFGGSQGNSELNDLWMYCVPTNQWIWISGDSTLNPMGNWGMVGVSNSTNKPSGRRGSVGWIDYTSHLYLFGGGWVDSARYNDLWKYTIDTTCGVCPTSTNIQENDLTNELLIFPNPTNSSLTISFQSSEKQTVELRIYNTLGKQVYFSKEEIAGGKFEKEINVERFSNGIYFLQVRMKDGVVSKKVIVSHP